MAEAAPWWSKYPEVAAPATVQDVSSNLSTSPAAAKPSAIEPAKISDEQHSALHEIGRQLGLTMRAGVAGAAALPAMLSDAVTGPVNAGLDATLGKDHGFRFERASDALGGLMTRAGIPEPKNTTERVVQDAASGMASAGGFVGAGKLLANSAGPVASAVGDLLAAGPGLQTVSGGAGAGASGVVRENGGGAGAQAAAGIAGALAPGLAVPGVKAAARGILRGGEEGRQNVADNIANFEAAGTSPTLAQATDGGIARATESLLAKIPGGAGVIAKKAQKQADEMQVAVQNVSDALAPGASAVNAGEAIMRGVQGFKQGFKKLQQSLYDRLDDYIPSDTPISAGNTEFALKELNADIPGAPNLSELFKNARIKGIDRALQADLDQAATMGTLPYEAIKKLRTLVGNEIADASLIADVPRSKWNPLYAALSDDLGEAAKKVGPAAEQAWSWANQFTRTQLARLEDLSGILSKDAPEKVFSAAISGSFEGNTVVRRVVSALPMKERREFAAAVLQRMGRATAGQQNAEGNAFSSETFLSNLSKMSQTARQTLFGRTDAPGIEEQVQQLAKVAESRRAGGRVFANPSGTAPAAAQLGMGGAIGAGVVGLATGAGLAPLAGALTLPATAYGMARVMTSDLPTRFAAGTTTLKDGAEAAAVASMMRSDPSSQSAPTAPWWHRYPVVDAETRPAPMPPDPIKAIGNASSVDEAVSAAINSVRNPR
jgi:hypothetical protein